MRLLLVHHAYPPEAVGGSEIYTAALARRLAADPDHEVTVLHRSADPARPDHDLRSSVRDGVRLLSLNNLFREMPGFESYRDPKAAAAAGRLMDEIDPELVHVGHLNGLSTGVVFEARRRGLPVVITLHDFWTVCPLGQLLDLRLNVCPGPTPRRCLACVGPQVAAHSGLAGAVGRALPWAAAVGATVARIRSSGAQRIEARLEEMREVLRAADVLLSPSAFLRDRMASLDVGGIRVLPNGHEPLTLPPRAADPQDRVRFGFVGSVIPSKGAHVLAEAFRRLDDPRAALRVHGGFAPYHGDTGYEARLRGILGRVAEEALRGAFAPDALGEVLSGLDVVVVPSIWEENAPLTVQEAFLARLPLIVSNHGGLREMVREGVDGLRFRPGDADDLARAMRRMLDEPGLRQRLGLAPPTVPTMEEHVRALEPIYAEARQRSRSRPGRVGVVVLDRGHPEATRAAVRSAADPTLRPAIVVVENGPAPDPVLPEAVQVVRLPTNRGFAGGMNAGIDVLRGRGCDRILLLNNDATLEPGCLRALAEAVEDQQTAAAGPTVLRASDGRVESCGATIDLAGSRFRLLGHGRRPPGAGLVPAEVLTGVALMLRLDSLDRVGLLDEGYFHGFEDVDWCVRARAARLRLWLVRGARVRHEGSATLGSRSPDRLYYGARNHLRAVEKLRPMAGFACWRRRAAIAARYLAYALVQRNVPASAALQAALRGIQDFGRGCTGPSHRADPPPPGGR